MGEAWFMGERKMYPELQGDLASLSAWDLQIALAEIPAGTSSFGPLGEWHDWYHYLLGQLVPRAHDAFVYSLVETLISGFISQYPNGVFAAPYRQFLEDSLMTLGRCMMAPANWTGSELVIGSMLHRSNNNPNKIWLWEDASGDFSASMFFCLKYLPVHLQKEWLESVLAINSPHWRAQVLVWLIGAHEVLNGNVRWPSEFEGMDRPRIGWDWSHCLRSELAERDASGAERMDALLTDESRLLVLATVRSHFNQHVFADWRQSILSVDYLESELGALPEAFRAMYVR
jgi:hypothetical protein